MLESAYFLFLFIIIIFFPGSWNVVYNNFYPAIAFETAKMLMLKLTIFNQKLF